MAEPLVLLLSENARLAAAIASCGELAQNISTVRVPNVAQAALVLAESGSRYSLAVVDCALPEAAVRHFAALAARHGLPWLAVASCYSPHLREWVEPLGAIDVVVADADDAHLVARFVSRLLKNRTVGILVVEDSTFMRLFLRRTLRRYQFRVYMARSAAIAMRILERRPDMHVVIMDYAMPGQNGVELTRAIRRRFGQQELCLIGISGQAPRAIAAEFLKHGGDDYLHKPFGREELYCRVLHGVEAVERMLEIKRLERSRRMFLSMLAHDLKSPAGGIVGAANLILDGTCGSISEDVREMAAVISLAGRRLCTLTGEIQDLTRLELRQVEPICVMSSLGDLVMERVGLAAALASGKAIRLLPDVADVPLLRFDPDLMARVLDNLLSNAVKYSPGHSVVRVLLNVADDAVVLRVIDSGPGILLEERGRLFKPFERLSARPTAGEKSLGLGLAITEGIVVAHGGRIWVEGETGQGATFCVALPLPDGAQSPGVRASS